MNRSERRASGVTRLRPTVAFNDLFAVADTKVRELILKMADHYLSLLKRSRYRQPEGVAAGLHEAVDKAVAYQIAADKDNGKDIKCRRGCSHCCKTVVHIWEPEAKLLKYAAEEAGVEIDRARLERQRGHELEEWKSLPPEDRACVFLDSQGSCRIYEHRPNACRKYLVVSDPELCDTIAHPGAQVLRFATAEAEVAESAALTIYPSGTMADMLLKVL